jgi:type I restriction enzyme S subunit
MTNFPHFPVRLPGRETQDRIANILSCIDEKITLNTRINHNLEEQAQALYKSWFEDNSECENWPKTSLSAFFNVITGKKDANFSSPDGPYPFFTCSQAPLRAPSYSFEGKAILMAGNGDFNVKRYIGKFEAYQRTYVLIPFEDKYQSFLYLLMSLHLGDITGGSRGSVIKFITKGNIADYSFRFPPYCIDDKLAVLNSIYAQVDEHNAEIEHLSRLRDQLLPKLISGDYCC